MKSAPANASAPRIEKPALRPEDIRHEFAFLRTAPVLVKIIGPKIL
jgi:hypothetical protein